MGDGGFRYFLEKGIVYGNAHHAHANTETIVGHATLATGAHPSAHGMIGNIWFDRGSGSLTYNIEDSRYGLLTEGWLWLSPARRWRMASCDMPGVVRVDLDGEEAWSRPSFSKPSRRAPRLAADNKS